MSPSSTENQVWSEEELERFRRLYAWRSYFEAFTAREAARQVAKGRSAKRLEDRYQEMLLVCKQDDYAAFLKTDMAFHRTIAELTEIPGLPETWDTVAKDCGEFATWAHKALVHDLETIARHHRPLLDAITTGSAKAAAHRAQAELDWVWLLLREQPLIQAEADNPVERVCAYIIRNLTEQLSLTSVARDVAHLSPSHLAKLFRDTREESFTAYVQRLRLNRAAALLRETDLSVQIIATRVGYGDYSRFTAHFRRRFGSTPSEWRRK